MNGPYENGTFGNTPEPSEWEWENSRMERGATYRVVTPFLDADGNEHRVGEQWVFVASMFSKFDDELSLCIRLRSGEEWKIPLIWRPDAHEDVIERFKSYVTKLQD